MTRAGFEVKDWVLGKCQLLGKATGPLEVRSRGQTMTTEGDSELPLIIHQSGILKHYQVTRQPGLDQKWERKLLGCGGLGDIYIVSPSGLLMPQAGSQVWPVMGWSAGCHRGTAGESF